MFAVQSSASLHLLSMPHLVPCLCFNFFCKFLLPISWFGSASSCILASFHPATLAYSPLSFSSSLLLSLRNNRSIQLTLSSFFLLCYASCLSFVFSELSGFPQSLFPLPVAFHLPLYLFFSILHPLISPISSSHPFSLLSSLLHFSPILSPYIGSYISSSYSFLSFNSLFSSPLSRLAPFWLLSEYSGYSSFTDRKDLWMTTAGFHCHRKIATVLYYERDGGNVCTCVCVCLVPIRRCSTCRLMWPASCRYKNYSARWDST